jgi:hypothetical protein
MRAKFAALLRVGLRQMLDYQTISTAMLNRYFQMARVEPIVIIDGHDDYVLLSAEDYRALVADAAIVEDLSAKDRAEVGRFATHLRAEATVPQLSSDDIRLVAGVLREMVHTRES